MMQMTNAFLDKANSRILLAGEYEMIVEIAIVSLPNQISLLECDEADPASLGSLPLYPLLQ